MGTLSGINIDDTHFDTSLTQSLNPQHKELAHIFGSSPYKFPTMTLPFFLFMRYSSL